MKKNWLSFIVLLGISILTFSNAVNAQKKNKFRVGVALYSFNQHSFEESLRLSESVGVPYVEGFSFYNLGEQYGNKSLGDISGSDIEKVKVALSKRHLSMTSMYVGGADGVTGWKHYFELGKALGVKYFVSEPPREQLKMVDSLAGIYHIKIALHNHAKPSGYWHPDTILAAIKGLPNIGACADIGHWTNSGLNAVECLKKLRGHVFGLHLKDVNKNHQDVLLGTGIIDFDSLTKELKAQHFNGYVQVECEHDMDNNVGDVKKAVEYFRGL